VGKTIGICLIYARVLVVRDNVVLIDSPFTYVGHKTFPHGVEGPDSKVGPFRTARRDRMRPELFVEPVVDALVKVMSIVVP
jgi:hypothetical protein